MNHDHCNSRRMHRHHSGKTLALLAIMLPSLLAVVGLVVDGGLMLSTHRQLQNAIDSGALAGAVDLQSGKSSASATSTAQDAVQLYNNFPDAQVEVNIPPTTGQFAGRSNHIELIATVDYQPRLMPALGGVLSQTIRARSVAGVADSQVGAALAILDPEPANLDYTNLQGGGLLGDTNAIAISAANQSAAVERLESEPIVGLVAATLLQSELNTVFTSVIQQLADDVAAQLPTTSAPSLLGGLEIEGSGRIRVDGAVHVNNEWGDRDERGEPCGQALGPPNAVACMPLLSTTRLHAHEIRVVGGVDDENNYLPFLQGARDPLRANSLPVPDPFEGIPTPSAASDPGNVAIPTEPPVDLVVVALSQADAQNLLANVLGNLPFALQPLFTPLVDELTSLLTQQTISPGVYNSITVFSPGGGVTFSPGIYIIRGTNASNLAGLTIVGPVNASGVMFYVTDSASFDAATGLPDAAEDPEDPPTNNIAALFPSVLMLPLLPGTSYSGLNDPSSPFDGMLIFQRQRDRRPILIEGLQSGSGNYSGTIYAKWGHSAFVPSGGSYGLRFASGTMRTITVGDALLNPQPLLPVANDVLLLE